MEVEEEEVEEEEEVKEEEDLEEKKKKWLWRQEISQHRRRFQDDQLFWSTTLRRPT